MPADPTPHDLELVVELDGRVVQSSRPALPGPGPADPAGRSRAPAGWVVSGVGLTSAPGGAVRVTVSLSTAPADGPHGGDAPAGGAGACGWRGAYIGPAPGTPPWPGLTTVTTYEYAPGGTARVVSVSPVPPVGSPPRPPEGPPDEPHVTG